MRGGADAPAAWCTRCSAARSCTLGYDRDFGELAPRRTRSTCRGSTYPTWTRGATLGLDAGRRLRVPAGTALDLGATGKAWAADLVATGLERELGVPAVVSLGGDVAGRRTRRPAVARRRHRAPRRRARRPVVGLDPGGLATSSTQVRRWSQAGVARHHLLDPRTGRPAPEIWRTVTATGPTCVAANTASTAAVVLGAAAPAWLREHEVTARLVAADGTVHHRRLAARPRSVDAQREAS